MGKRFEVAWCADPRDTRPYFYSRYGPQTEPDFPRYMTDPDRADSEVMRELPGMEFQVWRGGRWTPTGFPSEQDFSIMRYVSRFEAINLAALDPSIPKGRDAPETTSSAA